MGSLVRRQFANTIMLIVMVGTGLSLSVWLMGNRDLGLQICLGTVIIGAMVLVIGGYFVARTRS